MDHRGFGIFCVWMFACQPVPPPATDEAPAPTPEPAPSPTPAVVLPREQACEAKVADAPVALFADRVLVRLPVGVEVVELAPERARTTGEVTSACGAVVRQVVIGTVAHEPGRSHEALRDAMIKEIHGLGPGAVEWSPVSWSTRRGDFEASYTIAAVPGLNRGAVRGLFVIRERPRTRQTVWALYEAHPDVYPTLEQTFHWSSMRIFVLQ